MVIMALDHTRDFMHMGSLNQDPLNLTTTTPLLFLTRWITHYCAPVFVFLSGTSAFISMRNRKDITATRRFLISRGILLIILEFTVINFGLWYDLHFRILLFQVIAAIGFGFIVLSFLLKLRPGVIATVGLIIIFTHNLFPIIPFQDDSVLKAVLTPLVNFNQYQVTRQFTFVIAYPFIPWFGIMLTGFAAGKLFGYPIEKRKKVFLGIGLAALVVFVVLRLFNVYGDQSQWSSQKDGIMTFLSFINVSKYPPSLLFTLMTLGVMCLVISIVDGVQNKFISFCSIFGRVPFFYYLIHLYLIHSIMLVIMFLQGFRWTDMSFAPFRFGRAEGSGIELWVVYLVWISIVGLLYPVCKWYGKYKLSHKENKWLRYL